MSSQVTVTLYKKKGCPPCNRFLPEWAKFQELAKQKNIKTITYDSVDNSNECDAAGVHAFPTIIVSGKGEYNGDRTADALLAYVLGQKGGSEPRSGMPPQCGGSRKGSNEYYRLKYLKYKAKYMLIRSRLEN